MPKEVIWELWYVPYEKILHYGWTRIQFIYLLIMEERSMTMAVRGQLLKFGSCLPLVEAGSL